jgi:hypothetical protein
VVILENLDVDRNNKPHWAVRLHERGNSALKAAYVIKNQIYKISDSVNAKDQNRNKYLSPRCKSSV